MGGLRIAGPDDVGCRTVEKTVGNRSLPLLKAPTAKLGPSGAEANKTITVIPFEAVEFSGAG